MRLSNYSTSAVLRSFAAAALAGDDGRERPGQTIVWIEFAPQHPKVVGALWASLVQPAGEALQLRDERDLSQPVHGLGRRYERFSADAPRLAGRARPKYLRLVAPEALAIPRPGAAFVALAWPGQTPAQSLAAMLERGTPCPILIGWGDYLLAEALARGCARPLVASRKAPPGYLISGQTPWDEIISKGVKRGHLTLDGQENRRTEAAAGSPPAAKNDRMDTLPAGVHLEAAPVLPAPMS